MALNSAKPTLETSISQLQSILQNAPEDAASRQKLYYAAQNLATELEGPRDTAQRLLHIVRKAALL